MKQPRPTITQFVVNYAWECGLAATLALAAFFRLYNLSTLAPGLGQAEAQVAVRALALQSHPSLSIFTEARSLGASLFIALQALFVRLLGSTFLGIRVLPALLGVAAVACVYLWLSNWFSRRIGVLGALLYAVTPWIVTASRRGDTHSLILLTVPLVIWLFTRAIQTGIVWRYALAGAVLGLSLTNDLGSAVLLVSILLTLGFMSLRRRDFLKHTGKGIGIAAIGFAAVITLSILTHLGQPTTIMPSLMPDLAIAKQSVSHWATSTTKTLFMFNVHGDENFSNNVAGAPLLNFFVGLMLVMGLLVSVSRINRARYGGLLAFALIFLIPAILSPYAPDGRAALAAAPIMIALAAVGISYLLDIWHSTFPVNAAARTIGMLPIVFLMGVTIYQGYKQYFVAWGGSPEVYQAYNEPANAIAGWSNRTAYSGQRFIATDEYSRNVLDYLTRGKSAYTAINQADIAQVPADDSPKQIVVASSGSDDVIKSLKERFPKAKLSQHYSEHNDDNELFLVFEVLK